LASSASSGGSVGLGGPAADGQTSATAEDHEDLLPEEEVTNIEGWAPSVTLEVRNDVETGEEDEDVVYCQRSKLLRFKDSEWKERGIGEAKILKNRNNGQCRFLFRQERTSYLRANFYIVEDANLNNLKPNQGNMKIWTWMAQDYADDEVLVEQFALKFKDEEQANEFKKAFDKAKTKLGATAKAALKKEPEKQESTAPPPAKIDTKKQESTASPPANCLAAMAAQQAAGKWKCSVCGLMWGEELFVCGSCESPRPGYEDQVKESSEKSKQAAMNAFLGTSSGGQKQGGFNLTSSTASSGGFNFPPSSASSGGFNFTASSASSGGIMFAPSSSSSTCFSFPTVVGAPSSGSSLFGNSAGGGSNVFGGSASSGSSPVIFGGSPGGGLFGAPSTGSSPGIFGSSPGGGLFGAPSGAFDASTGSGHIGSATPASLFNTNVSPGLFNTNVSLGSPLGSAAPNDGLLSKAPPPVPQTLPPAPVPTPITPLLELQRQDIRQRIPATCIPAAHIAYAQPAALEEQRLSLQLREEMNQSAISTKAQHMKDIARLEAALERSEARARKTEDQLRVVEDRCAKIQDVSRLESSIREQVQTYECIEARARKAEDQVRTVEDRFARNQESLRTEVHQVRQRVLTEVSDLRQDSLNLKLDQGKLKSEVQAQLRSTADTAERALEATTRLEDVVGARVLALESKFGSHDKLATQGKSIADQIMYFRTKEPRAFAEPVERSATSRF